MLPNTESFDALRMNINIPKTSSCVPHLKIIKSSVSRGPEDIRNPELSLERLKTMFHMPKLKHT